MTNIIKRKLDNIIVWLTFFGLIFLALLYFYWNFIPIKVLTVCEASTLTNKVKAGSWIQYKLKYNAIVSMVGDNDRRLISADGNNYQIPLQVGDSYKKMLGKNEATIFVKIPDITPPGKYVVHTTVTWPHSGSRTYTPESYDTTPFEVVEK